MKKNKIFNFDVCKTLAFINFMFALFLNTMVLYTYYHHREIENIEGFLYLAISNIAFVVFAVLSIVKAKKEKVFNHKFSLKKAIQKYYPLTIVLIVVVILAVKAYDIVPIYDANLYYGSFIQIFDLYKFDIKSTIGAINVWNNIYIGTALFVSPFECFAVGRYVGTYIANTILFAVTLVVLYKFLETSLVKSNKWLLTFLVIVFAFSPYSFNLITYICPDFYLELYFIWLLYAYKKDNQLMVSFLGFLLCFTKTAGALMYAVFVFSAYVISNIIKYKKTSFKWWAPKNWPIGRFILWIVPAIIFFVVFMTKEKFQLQYYADMGSASYGLNITDVTIQSLQNYVFGYRWAICLIAVVALVVLCVKRGRAKKKNQSYLEYIDKKSVAGYYSIVIATVVFSTFLCFFTMSHCPRYTTVNNVAFVLILAVSISVLADKEVIKSLIALLFAALMTSQIYTTTDPAIKNLCEPLDMGNDHEVYNLVLTKLIDENAELPWLPRCLGDVYVYNEEYSVYYKLMKEMLVYYNPKNDIDVQVYGVDRYELHAGGNHYGLFWDKTKQRQTFKKTKRTIDVNGGTLEKGTVNELPFGVFYLIVPSRIDEKEVLKEAKDAGYRIDDSFVASSDYGSMKTYKLVNDSRVAKLKKEAKKKALKKKAKKAKAVQN